MANKVKVYIASSLDGFIARKDDRIDWLEAHGGSNEDYGYDEFIKNVGAAVMGARTYAECVRNPDRLLPGMTTYVVSKKEQPTLPTAYVEFIRDDIKGSVDRIRRSMSRDVWIVGGGKLISACLNEGIVDEIYQFVAPVLLHEGIPLYPLLKKEVHLNLLDSKKYVGGMVKLHYSVKVN